MKKWFYVLFLFCCYSHSKVVEKTQAVINEQMISLLDLKNFEQQLRLDLAPPDLLIGSLYNKSELLKDRRLLLDYMVKRNLLFQLAEDKEIPNPSSSAVNKVIEDLKGDLSKENFYKKLNQTGLDIESLKKSIVVSLRNKKLLTRFVVSQIRVSEQEIETYYFSKHKKSLFKNFEYEFVSVYFKEDQKPEVIKVIKEGVTSLEDMAQSLSLDHKALRLKDRDIQLD